MKRTDLPALAVFAAVGAHRSFRAAARALGISVSAVSHAITGLEASLGVRILVRTTRSVAPTEAGQRLLEQLGPALAAIAEAMAVAAASQDRVSGTVRLSAGRSVTALYLVPVLADFRRVCPGVVVEISSEDGFVDIVSGGFDAGVRLGESLDQDMIAVRLGPAQRHAVVGAPAYLAGRAAPMVPLDLHDHACIRRSFGAGGINRWTLAKTGETVEVAVAGGVILNDDRLIVEAARAGAGLAQVFEGLAAEDLAAGRLIRVLQDWCPVFPGFYLYYPHRQLMRPALRAFIDFIRDRRP